MIGEITALVAVPVLAHAQQGGPPSNAPKPTKADAQKVIQIITNDKAKTQAYCDMSKVFDQMQAADQKNDAKQSKRSASKPTRWPPSSVPNTTK